MEDLAERTCIVTKAADDPAGMIRFVLGPDGMVVPDIRRKLPGRGVWVTAKKSLIQQAVVKSAFSRGLKANAKAATDLADVVEKLMADAALGALGFARKAGECITGSGKVDSLIRSGKAIAVLHASDGADDGFRKLSQAVFSLAQEGGPRIAIWRVFSSAQLNMALGATNVIHAALENGGAAQNCLRHIEQLSKYREMEPSLWSVTR